MALSESATTNQDVKKVWIVEKPDTVWPWFETRGVAALLTMRVCSVKQLQLYLETSS